MSPALPRAKPLINSRQFLGTSLILSLLWGSPAAAPEPSTPGTASRRLAVTISWGHESKSAREFYFKLLTNDLSVESVTAVQLETGDVLRGLEVRTKAGAGDVDGIQVTISCPDRPIQNVTNLQSIWRFLIEHSDTDTANRLKSDPAYRPDSRKLTVQMDLAGTAGFSLTVDQLLREKCFWVPELDLFISAGQPATTYAEHIAGLARWRGRRVVDELERGPEAAYEQYTNRWEDMGSPAYRNPHSVSPGHIVGLTWDSALAKFGVDRGANVWNDYGNPDHFNLGFDFGEVGENLGKSWKSQRLVKGLPIIVTVFERENLRYEIEQFAYPIDGPPRERRGDIAMVLLEKLRVTDLGGKAQRVALRLAHRREVGRTNSIVTVETQGTHRIWREAETQAAWLEVEGKALTLETNSVQSGRWTTNLATLVLDLTASESQELVLKLPSAPVPDGDIGKLMRLDFASARQQTERFWSEYLARGVSFEVPEECVNMLFRANLWHALRLPRRHGGTGPEMKLDLPYSNFAYDQRGTPWPVNQSVYVDYMLYDLRGYHDVSEEELAAIYRNNQEPNGHVGGFANWGVYTPGMIYSVAQHYLLSGDRGSFERLLPQTLKALDWCLGETRTAAERSGDARGLVLAPLNDLSHETKAWAFNQAYLYAGIHLLGQALGDIGHPRARECAVASRAIFDAVQTGFGHASMLSPLVQLGDHTWAPYVPVDALTMGRRLDIWYPTDVDCGALHLARLKALDPKCPLTSFLLLDAEDNLFLNHWGMANEPVYNQHATACLLRDEPKAAIRAFYSMMACAFSHSVFEPVEHRWAWGQYFGPPSTDGAWFELYRQMLLRELDDGSLLLCQATPRKWLEEGKQIEVQRAPTDFGPISFTLQSLVGRGEILATIKTPQRKTPSNLLLRFRHPDAKPLRSVTINGQAWTDFDPLKEWVRIPHPTARTYAVSAHY